MEEYTRSAAVQGLYSLETLLLQQAEAAAEESPHAFHHLRKQFGVGSGLA